jgi:hypothetical protein
MHACMFVFVCVCGFYGSLKMLEWIVGEGDDSPDDRDQVPLKLLSDYTVQQPGRQPSLFSPPWELGNNTHSYLNLPRITRR